MLKSLLCSLGRFSPVALITSWILINHAAADFIPPDSIFGQQGVILGTSTVTGVVASNADISVQGFSTFGGLTGGGALIATGLGGQAVGSPVTFNGSVTLGGNSNVNGPVNSGSTVVVGSSSTIGGSITAAGGVTTQSGATVSGNVVAGRSASIAGSSVVNGNVGANGSVSVGGTVNGNVTYGQAFTVNGSGTITGTTTRGATTVNPATYVPVQLNPTNTFTAGGTTVTNGGTTTNPLAPGTYGALNIGTFGNLNLTSGNYYFTSFTFNGGAINFLNVGPNSHVNIFVTGDVFEGTFAAATVNGQSYANATASLAADVLLETLGSVTLTGAGSSFGTIYAPTGDISINGNENLTGQLIAGGTVYAPGGINAVFVGAAAVVPEPASLLMLTMGVGALFRAGRDRRR